ncbi:MAG: WbqC family protein [Chitinophagaceae bacterium]
MNSIYIENQLFAPLDTFKIAISVKNIFLLQYETYEKMSFRNRYLIAGANGVIGLSVPLQNGRFQRGTIRDVKISYDERWQSLHWKAIESSYRKAPFWEYYAFDIEILLKEKNTFLFDFCFATWQWAAKHLKINDKLTVLDEVPNEVTFSHSEWCRNKLLPKNYLQNPMGGGQVIYTQVFQDRFGFLPGLSIIDFFMNVGPQAAQLLKEASFTENEQ